MKFFARYRAHVLLLVLVLLNLGIWAAMFAATPRGVLTVAVLNVGQGDSIFIESPTGVQLLIDGGPDSSLLRELPTVMNSFDRSLNAIIETHPDADHIAGFVDLLDRYEVGGFVEPGIPKDTLTWTALQKRLADQGIPRLLARRGMRLALGGGAELEVLSPAGDVSRLSANKTNEGGVVVKLTYGKASMLFMADVPSNVETELLKVDGDVLNADLLKVGHHGSRTSTSDAFVKAVTPSAALISVGSDNSYGHPTRDTLDTLTKNAATILRTDESGTIVFVSNGGEFVRTR